MSGSPAVPRPLEVELKYRVADRKAGEPYLDADDLAGFRPVSPVRSTQMEDRYIDTSDGALARAGFAARLRLTGKGTTVSVKSLARNGGSNIHRREEMEGPADRSSGPRDWPASDARSLILEQCGDAPLVELVTIRQLRRKRNLRSGSTIVELSLDEVDAVARGRVIDRFVELEVELVEGEESLLAGLDEVLAADPALSSVTGSKLESALSAIRGTGRKARRMAGVQVAAVERPSLAATRKRATPRRLRRAAATIVGRPDQTTDAQPGPDQAPAGGSSKPAADGPRLVVGKTPGVLADDHIAEAGRKVLRFHLARMLARESEVRGGTDPEAVHSMRVATRRQRAAWRVFGGAFRPGRTKPHRNHLRELARRLGAVRDLEVQLNAADEYRSVLSATEQRGLEPLLAAWRTHRNDARTLLIRELDSDGFRRWVDDYVEFVRHEGEAVAPVAPTQPHRVRDTAGSHIFAAYEGVRAYEPVLRWADVETLHELRIAGKWLRYTIEFVREALGPEAEPLITRVTAMQDHLGTMQDAQVTAQMARSFLVENGSSLSAVESGAIARYLVSREREVVRLRRSVGGPWRGVAGVRFRRALGRTVAGL